VRNLASISHLGMKTGEGCGIVLERDGKKLEGYNIPELEVFSAVDFAHAAATQRSDDPIPLDENSSRRESSALRRVRSNNGSGSSGSSAAWLQGRRVGNGNATPAGRTHTGVVRT